MCQHLLCNFHMCVCMQAFQGHDVIEHVEIDIEIEPQKKISTVLLNLITLHF